MNNNVSVSNCPRCKKRLNETELKRKVCFECGCIFSVNPKNGKTKEYSKIIGDSRKMNYRFWIKFFIFFLILWAIATVLAIVMSMGYVSEGWRIPVVIIGVILYAATFTFIQFNINVIRDLYITKEKLRIFESRIHIGKSEE